jgi:hypothetical protein
MASSAVSELQRLTGCKFSPAWLQEASSTGAHTCESLLAIFLNSDILYSVNESSLPPDWEVRILVRISHLARFSRVFRLPRSHELRPSVHSQSMATTAHEVKFHAFSHLLMHCNMSSCSLHMVTFLCCWPCLSTVVSCSSELFESVILLLPYCSILLRFSVVDLVFAPFLNCQLGGKLSVHATGHTCAHTDITAN